jgi:hypothetical protein
MTQILANNWTAGCPVPNPEPGVGIIAGLTLILAIVLIRSYIKDQP